ncbi:MAG: 3-hydroxyacyl-CoA dehydrogenase/enoyl-CoA hydratase family protein [Archaeoglobaceae archaeon]|nr:3-hydroxyacyl-CoA dehydrogenase/enoyl-CoA hydratase family protein [Archaeoglobaceae archaeon]MDW8118389.1 3-hydroxyacyl-CoA dehydrogenase/enoyl-CoA hydratase family protein [Archaeoglobaceae archaeon]
MGSGIAQVCATSGYEVYVRDIAQEFIDKAKDSIEKGIARMVSKGKITEEKAKEILGRLKFTLSIEEAVKNADLVIEAIPEVMDLKKSLFAEVQKYAKKDCIFATNTSGLSITELGNSTDRPDKFVGLHFFNPPVVMQLVEVVKGQRTSDETVKICVEFVKSIGKTPVVVKKDVAGFIVNRILVPYLTLAIEDVEKGIAKQEEIDAVFLYKYSFPMGPIELSDFVGLDVLHFIGSQWGLVPTPKTLKQKFEKKELGAKTGKGFYDWSAGRPKIPKVEGYDELRLIAPMVNIAVELIELGVADAKEIDLAMKLGTNMPKGVCELGDEIGLEKIIAKLEELYKERGYEILKPRELLRRMVSEGKTGVKVGKGFYDYGKTYKNIIVEKKDRIAKLTINRPQRLNTLDMETLEEISTALKELETDPEVRVLVITGAGDKAFSAGFDLQSNADFTRPRMLWITSKGNEVFSQIEKFPKPVIAAVNGYAFGGGCELALACDFRIMKKGAKIGLTEVALGLIPGWGGTQRLPKLVGVAKAKEMIMLAKRIDADEADKIGLAKAVDADKFEKEVMELANQLAEMPPVSLRVVKYAINFGSDLPTEIGKFLEELAFGVATSTQDVVEGITAFLEKRKPNFRGL